MDWLAGKSLEEALAQAQTDVKRSPAQAKPRIFLFQLLCVLGQWDRAMTQLNVVGELDAASLPMVHTYRQALNVEALREQVYTGVRQPLIFGQPDRWVALCLEALRLEGAGSYSQASELRAEAFELAPATPGRLADPQNEEFAWIADADGRLGPMIEAIVDGKFYWIPYCRISTLTVEHPGDLRDLVWTPAYFRWVNGGESVGLIPTRYAASASTDDDRLRLSARTEWVDLGDGCYRGLGQRVLITDVAEHALMDIREVVFNPQSDDA